MALVFRQTITTNKQEVLELYQAISAHLLSPLHNDSKVSVAEFLSIEPLRKVGNRLFTRYQRAAQNLEYRQFSFTLTPQEVIAITLCIRNRKQSQLLDVILGKIQQRSLNLDSFIKFNEPTWVE